MKRCQTLRVGLTGEERRGEDDVPHPALAVDLRVEAARHIARHAAGQSVQDDGCRVDGTVAVHIEHPQQRHNDDSYCNDETDQTPAFVCICHYQVSNCYATKTVATCQCCSELVCSVFKENNDSP